MISEWAGVCGGAEGEGGSPLATGEAGVWRRRFAALSPTELRSAALDNLQFGSRNDVIPDEKKLPCCILCGTSPSPHRRD